MTAPAADSGPVIKAEDYPGMHARTAEVINTFPPHLRKAIARSPASRICELGEACPDNPCESMHPWSEQKHRDMALLLNGPVAVSAKAGQAA